MTSSLSKKGAFGVLSFAHMINDGYTNIIPQLIPFLISGRGFSVSKGAALIAAFSICSSLVQPVFGYLVDQKGQRWLVYVGTLWMGTLLGILGFVPFYPAMLLISALAGLGTAAFHPQAMSMVGQRAGNRKGFLLGFFIAMGNLGIALSPVVFLPMFKYYGYHSTWVVIIPGMLTALLLYIYAPTTGSSASPSQTLGQALAALRKGSRDLNKLMLVVAIRSLVHTGLMMLMPLYLLDKKFSVEVTGYLMFLTLAAGSVGGIIGGYISDRYGRKILIVSSLVLAAVFFYGFMSTGGILSFVLLFAGSMALLSSMSVTVAAAQEIIPQNKALASGLSLGFAIGMGALAITPVGKFADVFGLESAVRLVFTLPLVAALAGIFLSGNRQEQKHLSA